MYCKKLKGLLFAILTIGVTHAPSDSWSMHRENPDSGSLVEYYFPSDVLKLIFWNLDPREWVRAGEACKYWLQVSNSKNLWGNLNGQTLLPYNDTVLQALTTLFKITPSLQSLFKIDLSKSSLEELLPETIKKPAKASYKNFFISQYLESSALRKHHIPRQYQKYELLSKAKEKMEEAYKQGNLKAGRKVEFSKIKALNQSQISLGDPTRMMGVIQTETIFGTTTNQIQPYNLTQQNITGISKTKQHYLTAALLGSSKAQSELGSMIVDHLISYAWVKTVITSGYSYPVYSGVTPAKAEQQLDALINLGTICPAVREPILHQVFSPEVFEAIGEGKEAKCNFLRSYTLEWPEAFEILGSERQLFPVSVEEPGKIYFEKAIEKGVQKSKISLARILSPTQENESCLRNILEDNPHSGTVLSKLAQILIAKIPNDAGFKHESVNEFFNFFKEAYKRLSHKREGLLPGFLHRQQDTQPVIIKKRADLSIKIKTPENLIKDFGNHLNQKSRATKRAFLDLVMQTPSYDLQTSYDFQPWVSETIKDHLRTKWGRDFLNYILKLSPSTKTDNWDQRDTLYSLAYLERRVNQIPKRDFYKTLMAISLKKKEEDWFVKAYKLFCDSVASEVVGIRNYKFLSVNKDTFKKLFPKNTEVERLFKAVPQPKQKPVQKRKRSSDDSFEISPSDFVMKVMKKNDDDSWDGDY